jgi:glycosyltransferase involved in cell wall biosynthesis
MTQPTVPSVSAIIPTRNRPQMLERAIRSVLAQSYADFEIIVVIDGPDPNTSPTYCESIDPRIRCLSLPVNVGLAEARNEGIRHARGRWIALLDDDDEWLPQKLQLQVAKAIQMGGDYVFVPCKFIEKTRSLERVMPNHLPAGPLRFSEYIYCDQGYLQPSMYFMSRKLCLEVPFTKGLRHIEDSDWLLRATRHPGIQVAGIDEALSIYHNHKDGSRESELTPWKYSLEWAVDHRDLFTRRAFPFYVGRLGINARRAGEPITVLFQLIRTARRYGSLNITSLGYFFAYWLLPDHALRRIRAAFS